MLSYYFFLCRKDAIVILFYTLYTIITRFVYNEKSISLIQNFFLINIVYCQLVSICKCLYNYPLSSTPVFCYSHSLLDAKINSVLSLCHDQVILNAVHSIIENMIACGEASQQQLSYLQSKSFKKRISYF